MERLTDEELLAIDASAEIEVLRAQVEQKRLAKEPDDPLWSYLAPLAIWRKVAEAQFEKDRNS